MEDLAPTSCRRIWRLYPWPFYPWWESVLVWHHCHFCFLSFWVREGGRHCFGYCHAPHRSRGPVPVPKNSYLEPRKRFLTSFRKSQVREILESTPQMESLPPVTVRVNTGTKRMNLPRNWGTIATVRRSLIAQRGVLSTVPVARPGSHMRQVIWLPARTGLFFFFFFCTCG